MKTLYRSLLAVGALLAITAFSTAAMAGSTHWGISLNIPLATNPPVTTYSSTTYGPIQSYTQVPQTVCTTQWNNGYPNQVCTTEYTPAPNYAPPHIVYSPPPALIIQGGNGWGYPGYRPPSFHEPRPPQRPRFDGPGHGNGRWDNKPPYRSGPGSLGIHGGYQPHERHRDRR